MFDHFNMKSKLFALLAIVIVGLVVAGAITYFKLDSIRESYDENTNIQAKSDITSMLLTEGLQCGQALRNLYISSKDKQALSNLNKSMEILENKMEALKALDKKVFTALEPSFLVFLNSNKAVKKQIESGLQIQTNDISDNTVVWRTFKSAVNKENQNFDQQKKQHAADFKTTIKTAQTMTFAINSLIIVMLVVAMLLIIRSVTRSIADAVQRINEGAMQILGASDQVASSSTSLAQGASEQASSVEEINATLEEASAAVASNTQSAREADMLSKAANQSAKDGMAKGGELVRSMEAVNDAAAKIADIVKAIDQIAFQVNLLALNAAVEAARAGEHGLGFSVVADEVKNLAQRAAKSAKETAIVIEETVSQIKKGAQIAHDADDAFKQIDEQSKKASDLIDEVAISGKEQANAVVQLSAAMGQIDMVAQRVAANSEEAAAAAEELNAQATSMLESVDTLGRVVGIDMK